MTSKQAASQLADSTSGKKHTRRHKTNTLALPIGKDVVHLLTYLLCPHSEHQKHLFQSKQF
jgi:hypothetical protein